MKSIPITSRVGIVAYALVDDADAPAIARWAWQLKRDGYAGRYDTKSGRNLRMHREVLGVTDPAQHIDHINGDRLDNRRANLRLATASENAQNRSRGYGRSSYRGVYWFKGAWCAQATVNRKQTYLGRYATEEEAAAVAAAYRAEHLPASAEARTVFLSEERKVA